MPTEITHLAQRRCEQTKVKEREDKSKLELQKFAPNDQVWVQDPTTKKWSNKAMNIRARNKRSYQVTDGVKEFPRNRRFLRPRVRPSKVDQVTNPQMKSNKGPKSLQKKATISQKQRYLSHKTLKTAYDCGGCSTIVPESILYDAQVY